MRQIRQRNRAYQRQRRTRNQHDKDRYRDLKHKTQKKIRQDYWKYLEDIVTPSEGNNTRAANKKFWSFVKHTRQDSVGIPNLTDTQGDEHTTLQGKAQALNQQNFCFGVLWHQAIIPEGHGITAHPTNVPLHVPTLF